MGEGVTGDPKGVYLLEFLPACLAKAENCTAWMRCVGKQRMANMQFPGRKFADEV
jgi:hypothetical protein